MTPKSMAMDELLSVGLHLVLPWLGLGIFNKMDITQGGLL